MRRTSVLLLWAVAACGGDGDDAPAAPPTLEDELQRTLEESVYVENAPGGTLAVVTPELGTWIGATGYADLGAGLAMAPSDRFGIGSITKTFTSAVLLQLAEEGKVSLDEPLATHYPDFPRAEELHLRHLLTHTSGIYDFAYDPDVLAGHDRVWDPEELVAIAAVQPPAFAPGEQYDYSNTNFILLGLVIEDITGETWAHEVRTRLLDPLGLADTFVASDEEVPGAAHGYFGSDDWTLDISPTTGWAAGAMVSNAPDLLRWSDALLYGDVLSEASREAMRTPVTLNDGSTRLYGLGLDLVGSEYGTRIGHGGDAIIYRASMYHLPEENVTIVALVNGFPCEAKVVANAAWDLLLPPTTPAP
jgi:D-alanyl-D-alanine carboxypeptidase